MSKFTNSLWKNHIKTGSENRTETFGQLKVSTIFFIVICIFFPIHYLHRGPCHYENNLSELISLGHRLSSKIQVLFLGLSAFNRGRRPHMLFFFKERPSSINQIMFQDEAFSQKESGQRLFCQLPSLGGLHLNNKAWLDKERRPTRSSYLYENPSSKD